MTLPAWQTDNAAITRALKTDSVVLRFTEWWVRRRIYGLADQESRWLFERYMQAYKEMAVKLTVAYDKEDRLNIQRRQSLLEQIEAEMNALMGDVANHLFLSELDAYRQGYYGRAWSLDMTTLPEIRVRAGYLPTDAIRASVLTPYVGRQWGETLQLARDEFVLRIKRSITTSIIGGESMAQAQRRLRDELGIPTDRRKGFKQNFYRTMLIARTEIMRASNLGALAVYEQNQDILSGWEWVVARDRRTCPDCQGLDGKRFKFGDMHPVPPSGSHPGCRCTAMPVLIDTDLMDRVAGGPRQTYRDWAQQQGIAGADGHLGSQRTSDAHGINTTS